MNDAEAGASGSSSDGSDARIVSLTDRARACAVAAHGDQKYGNQPYSYHLAAVVRVLEDFGFSEEHLAAGWLHDVAEDTSVVMEQIRAAFGDRIGDMVWAVTGEGYGDRNSHSTSIYDKIQVCTDAAAIKLADRIANVEASKAGDKHSIRYGREHERFASAIQPHVGQEMWERYCRGLERLGTNTA
jgi:guanosine-3',5'-bis(diphosphate) 3'-pyrophosphohydrolase